jgi:glycosyltransferase involved in cell wall biosynthesis
VLVQPAGAQVAPPAPWLDARAATPFDGRSANLAKLWFEQVAFPEACGRVAADVAFVPYWGAPWRCPCPVAVTVHDLIPLLLPLYRGGPAQRAYTALVSRTAQRAAAVLTDSEAGKRDVVAHLGIAPERVHAVHLAAGAPFVPVADAEALARVRAKYALPDVLYLLYLGGFDNRKNVTRMLEGYARLTPARPPFVIGGKLPAEDSAFAPDPRPVAARLGLVEDIRFIGWVDETDKPALYSMALAAVYVSEYEGFGLPVLEAMGCGCAVLAAK